MLKLIGVAIFLPFFFTTDATISDYCAKNIGNKQQESCRKTKTENNCTLETCCRESGAVYKCTRCLRCCDDNGCRKDCKSD